MFKIVFVQSGSSVTIKNMTILTHRVANVYAYDVDFKNGNKSFFSRVFLILSAFGFSFRILTLLLYLQQQNEFSGSPCSFMSSEVINCT